MRIPIEPFSRRAFNIDEFEEEEHDCSMCKHYIENPKPYEYPCKLNLMCDYEEIEDD